MPVPDLVVFGLSEEGKELTYGEVRLLIEEQQFRALKRRLDALFVKQVGELAKRVNGKRAVYSPFPLFILTCVGLETLGKVFFTRQPSHKETEDDIQREGFLRVCNRIHPHFSRPLNKQQKEDFDHLWGANEHKKVSSISHLIYRFGRHTMMHGYRGKGVYLTEDIPEWVIESGALHLNPYWFWTAFVRNNIELWGEFEANIEPTNSLKRAARLYLKELLG